MFTRFCRDLERELTGRLVTDAPLAPLCTFGIGGPASVLVEPASTADVAATLALCRVHGAPLYILGGGSNLLIPDEGLRGVVLRTAEALLEVRLDGDHIVAQAGLSDPTLAAFARDRERTGFEWLCDIPGTVGGAVYMNAGNNDGEVSHSVVSVRWLSPEGEVVDTDAAGLRLEYRRSRFHQHRGIILEATFTASAREDRRLITRRMDAITEMRRSKFPSETLCAGSVFKRPPGHYAGRLIEEAGCGGCQVGGALVSPRHKGFIVNRGTARAADVLELIELVRSRVEKHSGVRLETEVELFAPFLPGH